MKTEPIGIDSFLTHRFFFPVLLGLIMLPVTAISEEAFFSEKIPFSLGFVVSDRLFPAPPPPHQLGNLGQALLTMFLVDYVVYLFSAYALLFVGRKVVGKLRRRLVSS